MALTLLYALYSLINLGGSHDNAFNFPDIVNPKSVEFLCAF
jgi:hypothetical protein